MERQNGEKHELKPVAKGNKIFETQKIMKRRRIVVVFFDQKASEWGYYRHFIGVVPMTPLTDLSDEHLRFPVSMMIPQYTRIFRAKCHIEYLKLESNPTEQNASEDDYILNVMNQRFEQTAFG
jgi:hypothetical protein